jgi:hypothetical protein
MSMGACWQHTQLEGLPRPHGEKMLVAQSSGLVGLLVTASLLSACSGGVWQAGGWILALLGIAVVGIGVLLVLFWLSRRP